MLNFRWHRSLNNKDINKSKEAVVVTSLRPSPSSEFVCRDLGAQSKRLELEIEEEIRKQNVRLRNTSLQCIPQ